MKISHPPLIQLRNSDPMPSLEMAWGPDTVAPGLLAVGGGLSVERLIEAYGQACFPWYSDGQPVMWWSTNPRMVLPVADFRLPTSLRKQLKQLISKRKIEIRVDHDFFSLIDCQQNTRHLASLGAKTIPRQEFLDHVNRAKNAANLNWKFDALYWNQLMLDPLQT